jgi:hypothetical protein
LIYLSVRFIDRPLEAGSFNEFPEFPWPESISAIATRVATRLLARRNPKK